MLNPLALVTIMSLPSDSSSQAAGFTPNYLDVSEHAFHFIRQWDVYFDGEKQKHCTRADTKYGYIIRIKTTKFCVPIKGCGGRWHTEKLFGRVDILPAGTDYAFWRATNGPYPKR